jgi:ferritin
VQLYVNYALGGGSQASFDKIDVRGEESITHLEVMKGYINQLREIMKNCKNISETTWEQLDYRIYSLKNLIRKYNKCK